ncbi:MAG: peptidoglycan-binding domain-containing protein [Gammaproteobacteria bacterium]|jgi:hypothetical protein
MIDGKVIDKSQTQRSHHKRTTLFRAAALLLLGLLVPCAALQAADRSRVVYHVQMRLMHEGYNPGPADGIMGKKTRRAIAKFQWDNNLEVTGALNQATFAALGLTVYSYANIGAARLKVLDIPPVEYTRAELVKRVKQLKVQFDGSRNLTLFNVNGFEVHTGQIEKLIETDCLQPYEISIGEMYIREKSLKAADYGDIFADALKGKLQEFHSERSHKAIRNAQKEMVFICTAAMF